MISLPFDSGFINPNNIFNHISYIYIYYHCPSNNPNISSLGQPWVVPGIPGVLRHRQHRARHGGAGGGAGAGGCGGGEVVSWVKIGWWFWMFFGEISCGIPMVLMFDGCLRYNPLYICVYIYIFFWQLRWLLGKTMVSSPQVGIWNCTFSILSFHAHPVCVGALADTKMTGWTGWWFGTLFFNILGIVTPTDFHIFQRVWNHRADDFHIIQLPAIRERTRVLSCLTLNRLLDAEQTWFQHSGMVAATNHRHG